MLDPEGRRVVDFAASNLHVVNYSKPVQRPPTQFDMRILTKLVAKPGLELRVDLRLPTSAEVSDVTTSEAELALRELGLDDEVGRD